MHLDESTGRITHFMKKRTADEIELDVSLIPQLDAQQPLQQQRSGGRGQQQSQKHRHAARAQTSSVNSQQRLLPTAFRDHTRLQPTIHLPRTQLTPQATSSARKLNLRCAAAIGR